MEEIAAMDWLLSPFETVAQQQALAASAMAAVALAIVGTWVVIRGMSFLGDALAHGVIPGIAAALLFGVSPLLGAVVAAIVMIAGIGLIHRQTTFSEDTGIGLLFVGMLALGVAITSRSADFPEHVTEILFGETLAVDTADVITVAAVAVVTVVAAIFLYRPLLVLSFNEQKAKLVGMRPGIAHVALLTLITLGIVGSFQTVGTLLVFGLLIGPPAAAALIVRRVPAMMVMAVSLGLLSVVIGLILGYYLDISPSASMSLVAIAIFFSTLVIRSLRGRARVPSPA